MLRRRTLQLWNREWANVLYNSQEPLARSGASDVEGKVFFRSFSRGKAIDLHVAYPRVTSSCVGFRCTQRPEKEQGTMWTKCSVVAWPDKEYQILHPRPTWQYVVRGLRTPDRSRSPIVVQSSRRTVKRMRPGDSRVGTPETSCYRKVLDNEAG